MNENKEKNSKNTTENIRETHKMKETSINLENTHISTADGDFQEHFEKNFNSQKEENKRTENEKSDKESHNKQNGIEEKHTRTQESEDLDQNYKSEETQSKARNTNKTIKKVQFPLLKYRNINVTANQTKILHDINLNIYDNSITAVIGLSGAGKTTLLKVLCGYLNAGEIFVRKDALENDNNPHKLLKQTEIDMSGEEDKYLKVCARDMRKFSSLVPQHDDLPDFYTVKDFLRFVNDIVNSSYKKPEKSTSDGINEILDTFNMGHIKDTKIGTSIRGISGGERRRVEIISEILADRKVIFLDEPTTGLDVHNALEVVKNLRSISSNHSSSYQQDTDQDTGKSVVLTIHQPARNLFFMADYLLVVTKGRVMCHLKTRDVLDFFQANSFKLDYYTNPAEYFFTDFISQYEFNEERKVFTLKGTNKDIQNSSFYDLQTYEITESQHNDQTKDILESVQSETDKFQLFRHDDQQLQSKTTAKLTELWVLMKRTASTAFSKTEMVSRVGQAVITGLIFGLIFYKLGDKRLKVADPNLKTPVSAQNNEIQLLYINSVKGFIYSVLTNSLFSCAHIGLRSRRDSTAFREIFSFRYSCFLYCVSNFFFSSMAILIYPLISNTISLSFAQLPYNFKEYCVFYLTTCLAALFGLCLGLLFNYIFLDELIATILMPAVLGPQIMLSGMVIANSETAKWLQYLSNFAVPRYTFHILCINSFERYKNEIQDPVARKMMYDEDFYSIKTSFLIIIAVIAFSYIASYFAFRRKTTLKMTQ